jgi:hypothetical protein
MLLEDLGNFCATALVFDEHIALSCLFWTGLGHCTTHILLLFFKAYSIQSILGVVIGLLGYISHSLPPQDIHMFKGLFEQRTLTLVILILSVVNSASAILSANWPMALGWISSVAGWYAVWDLSKHK